MRPGGGGQTERRFLDFFIDNVPLRETLETTNITALGWLGQPSHEQAVGRLLRKESADLPGDRRSLYVCPECAELGCGAVSVVIERSEGKIVWRDFGYQNNYMPDVDLENYQDVGPFEFDLSDYYQVISSALEISNEQ